MVRGVLISLSHLFEDARPVREVDHTPEGTSKRIFCMRISMSEVQSTEGNPTIAVGAVKTNDQAEHLVTILRGAGFSDKDISVIAPGSELKNDPKIALDHEPGEDPADAKPREG